MKPESIEWLACMLIASIGLVSCLWVVPYIPTHDGPQHIFSAHIENHYSDAGSLYPEFYGILPQFAGKGFSLVFGPLESVLPWRVALRVTFSLVALAFAWGFALVVLALDRERRPTAMLGFAIALPWALYMGFFAFVVGTTVGLYTLAFVLRTPKATNARRALLSLLLLAQAVCHVFTAIATGATVAVLAVVNAPRGERLREAGRMALVGAPAAAILSLTFRDDKKARTISQPIFDWSLPERAFEISRWVVPGPGVRGWLVLGLVVVGIGATLTRSRTPRATPTEQALAWLAVGFLALTLFAPFHMPGWQFLAPRFVLLGTVLGLALLRTPELSPRATRALVPLLTAGCLASSLVSASLHRRLADGCAETLAGLDAPLRFEGPRLPIILEVACGAPRDRSQSPIPGATLAHNSPLLYLLDHGGIATRVFNGVPAVHAVVVRGARLPKAPPPLAAAIALSEGFATDPKLRTSTLTELAADGMSFEGIHVVGGRPDDFTVFKQRGYVTELQRDSLFIARFEGCRADLVLPAGALDREPVYYEVGLFSPSIITDEPRALAKVVIPRDTPVSDGRIHVPLAMHPCGEIWVRVVWDADSSSTLTPGDRTCENALWEGRLRATVSAEHASVSCAPR